MSWKNSFGRLGHFWGTSTGRTCAVAACLGGAFIGAGPLASAQIVFSNVVDNSMIAPGTSLNFARFKAPSIDGANIAFGANLNTIGDVVCTAVVGSTGASLIARNGTSAGADGTLNFGFGPIAAISGNTVIFTASSSGGFGGIYAGTVGTAGVVPVVNSLTPVPADPSKHLGQYQGGPAISGTTVAFNTSSFPGMYTAQIGSSAVNSIVDYTSTVPGQSVTFTRFDGSPAISGDHVVFGGRWTDGSGIYTGTAGASGASVIADTTMQAPGKSTNFTSFVLSSVSGDEVAFVGLYTGGAAIYTGSFGVAGATPVVETGMPIPGRGVTFTEFYLGHVTIGGGQVVFDAIGGTGADQIRGIFLEGGGAVFPVITTGDPLFGSTVTELHYGQFGFDADSKVVTFEYQLADGQQGIATANVSVIPEPTGACVFLIASVEVLRSRRRKLA